MHWLGMGHFGSTLSCVSTAPAAHPQTLWGPVNSNNKN